jgi:hypothetical protein
MELNKLKEIPILPDKIQQKIASLIQQSYKARRKAKELLEEVKRKVEDEIERQGCKFFLDK